VHGHDDDVVPIELSRTYVEKKNAQGEHARLVEIPQAGHFELIDPRSKAWPTVEGTVLGLLT
jgi:dipeptidyl aminopeptidase/acylaminoacyl peptidase